MKRWPALVSFVLFIALCISATYWAMQLFKAPPRPMVAPPAASLQPVRLEAALSLFGGRAAAVAVASNFQLQGVIVSDRPGESAAILATDGKPAQSVALNAEVVPGVIVKEVHRKYVLLSEGGVSKRVDLPENAQSQLQVDTAVVEPPAPPQMAPPPPPPASQPTIEPAPMQAPPPNDAGNQPPGSNQNTPLPPGAMSNR